MLNIDAKFWFVGLLFAALILAKILAGGRPNDRPVRRARRFGHRGYMSPLNEPGAREKPPAPEPPPKDPEEEFFGKKGP
ncbi:MAG TPA: hypothetical protein VGK67_25260 [Myxococcales bacterium]